MDRDAIVFREIVYLGKTARSAKPLECIADNFSIRDADGSVTYRQRILGSNMNWSVGIEDVGKTMGAVSLFQAACDIISGFLYAIHGELVRDPELKLFVEYEGKKLKANLSDVFGNLTYPLDEYSFHAGSFKK